MPGSGCRGMKTMCAACHDAEGVVEHAGEALCSRCGTLREWAFVIGLIQDRLQPDSSGAGSIGNETRIPADVAADPFAAA